MRVPSFLGTLPSHVRIPDAITPGSGVNVRLERGELSHLGDVLRLGPGSRIQVHDPATGLVVRGIIRAEEGGVVSLEVEAIFRRPEVPALTLIVGAVKPDRVELIVEKTTELGCRAIRIFDAERTNRPITAGGGRRLERLHKIAASALKQSGSATLPEIATSESLEAALATLHGASRSGPDRYVLVAPTPDASHTSGMPRVFPLATRVLETIHSPLETSTADVDFHLVIGPEGGLTTREVECASSYGYEPASLGVRVLRTDTAAVAGCALVNLLGFGGSTRRG